MKYIFRSNPEYIKAAREENPTYEYIWQFFLPLDFPMSRNIEISSEQRAMISDWCWRKFGHIYFVTFNVANGFVVRFRDEKVAMLFRMEFC